MASPNDEDRPRPLLSMRTAIVLTLAVLAGLAATALMTLAHRPLPEAVFVGLGVLAAAVKFFDSLIA